MAAPLEPTNEGYALGKILAAKLCEYANRQYSTRYRTVIPSNLYGRFDHFAPDRSHLVAAVIHKLHQAKKTNVAEVVLWGRGNARREFLFADDLAFFLLRSLSRLVEIPDYLNVGFGTDYSVSDYYRVGMKVVGYDVPLKFDLTKPTGMQRKLLDSTRAFNLGWKPETSLEAGMKIAYDFYLREQADTSH